MAFIITLLYGAALFSAGLWFVHSGEKKEIPKTHADHDWNGNDRRSGQDRREQPADLPHTL